MEKPYSLTFLEEVDTRDKYHRYARYRCTCGREKVTRMSRVKNGTASSCGSCAISWRVKNSLSKAIYGKSAEGTAWSKYKYTARKRNIEFKITKEEWKEIVLKNCYYCGCSPTHKTRSQTGIGDFISNGIDRVDNNRGYTKDNIVPCCRICNSFKSNFQESVFLDQVKRINDFQVKKSLQPD